MLKNNLDKELRRIYELTEAIKKLEPGIKEASSAAKTVFREILYEYQSTYTKTRKLLIEYIQQEREKGIAPIAYIRLYREKFGEENYESKTC